jgi:DNA polymerase-3 subunit gamma/tau
VRGKKKLYILDEVHMLSTSAFNALLKTLEEPPPHALFVFATTDPHKLPQTILSRVQRYDFKLVPTARLVEHLADVLTREAIEFDPGALYIIAREGAGSVRDSLSLLDQVLASSEGRLSEEQAAAVLGVADRRLIMALGGAIAGRDPATALSLLDDAFRRGFDLPQLARTLLAHLRDLVVVSVVKEPQTLLEVPASELPDLEAQAKQVSGRAELLFDRMMRVAEDTARASQARYALEVGLVELCALEPLLPIGELVDRLELLEDRLAGRGAGRGAPPAPSGFGPMGGPARTGGPGGSGPSAPAGGRSLGGPTTAAPMAAGFAPNPPAPAAPVMAAPLTAAPVMAAPVPSPAASPARMVPVASGAAAAAIAMPQPQEESDAIVEHKSISAPVPTVAPPRPVPPAPSDIGPPLRPAVPPVEAVAASEPRATPPAADPASLPATSREAVQAQAPVAKPAPPTSAAQPPANQDFATLVRYVTERAPALAYLREARALRWQDSQITIGLASDFDVQRTKNERPRLQELFNAAAGTPLVLEFVLDAQAAKDAAERETLAASEERARQAEQTRLRREASEHPSLKLVREVFGEVSFMEPELEAEVTVHG